MAEANQFVAALARAYSLSEIFALEEPPVREALERAAGGIGETLTLRIERGTVRLGDRPVEDEDGTVGELARDLEFSDVCELRFPGGVIRDDLEAFVSVLREGAGRGDGVRSADALARDLPGIGVAFAGAGAARSGESQAVSALFDRDPGATGSGSRTPVGAERSPASGQGDGEAEEPAGASEPARSAVEAPANAGAAAEPSPGADLAPAVSRYLHTDSDGAGEVERELRAAAERARRGGALDELAEAVERLALHDDTDGADGGTIRPRALARDLLDAPLAARIVLRLGASREEERRQERIEAASRLGGDLAPALTDALIDADDRTARRAYIDALVALGDEAETEVEAMLDDDRWFVVRNGVRILARIGDERDVGLLTSPLAHDDHRVRRETVMALGRIRGEDAETLVLGMLDDSEADVRTAVARALGALRSERAVKPLLQRLDEEDDEEAKIQVVRALGAIGDPGAVPALEKRAVGTFFSRPPRPLRVAAYRALAGIGTPHATELLEDAREDADETVRQVARSLLED